MRQYICVGVLVVHYNLIQSGKRIIRQIKKVAHVSNLLCTTYGNRTRDSSVKGRRLNPLTNAACHFRIANVGSYLIFPKNIFIT